MNPYQFAIEVNDSASVHEDKRLVMAQDDRAAERFARLAADNWQPNARLDSEHDIYSGPDGWPQWILSHCAPLTHLDVPVAGVQRQARIALVPCRESLTEDITRAADLVRALSDPSLSECSSRWVLSDHLGLSNRELSSTIRALDEVQNALGVCAERSGDDEAMVTG
jgi:hypothetical protein